MAKDIRGPRGIEREVWDGAFFPYEQVRSDADAEAFTTAHKAANPELYAWPDRVEGGVKLAAVLRVKKILKRDLRLARRAPGVIMRRFEVPEAYPVPDGEDPFLVAELRPEWPIATNLRRHGRGHGVTQHRHGIEPEAYPAQPASERDQGFPGPPWSREYARRKHVNRRHQITLEEVQKGVTDAEYEQLEKLDGWDILLGATHHGAETDELHVHVKVAKYVFPATPIQETVALGVPHAHTDFDDEKRYHARGELVEWTHALGKNHMAWKPDPDGGSWGQLWNAIDVRYPMRSVGAEFNPEVSKEPDPDKPFTLHHAVRAALVSEVERDEKHSHVEDEPDPLKHPAKRLSSHPFQRKDRWKRDRVAMAMEGCLKEAALVSAGEATFSCPSITLWDTYELERFVQAQLPGKQILVVCDSDWEPGVGTRPEEDDAVQMQALLLRDRLRLYLDHDDVHACAPPQPRDSRGRQLCDDPTHDKHGVDDFLGPCTHGKVDDLVTIGREIPGSQWDADFESRYYEQRDKLGRHRKKPVVLKDKIVLQYLATLAAPNGDTTVSLRAVAKNLQVALGSPTVDAARQFVEGSVKRLVQFKYVEEVEPIARRKRGQKYRYDFEDWPGKLRVLEPWRAETVLGRVGDLPAYWKT
jgi:hypothetical protein